MNERLLIREARYVCSQNAELMRLYQVRTWKTAFPQRFEKHGAEDERPLDPEPEIEMRLGHPPVVVDLPRHRRHLPDLVLGGLAQMDAEFRGVRCVHEAAKRLDRRADLVVRGAIAIRAAEEVVIPQLLVEREPIRARHKTLPQQFLIQALAAGGILWNFHDAFS